MKIIRQKSFGCTVEDIYRKENGLFRDKTTIITTTLPKDIIFKEGDNIKLSEKGKKIKITGIQQHGKYVALSIGSTPINQIKRGDKIIKL